MAPQFLQIGDDRYTCVPPPGYEIDSAVTGAIREFDPGLIPIWRVQLWRFPWELAPQRVVHHGIGRYYPVPRYLRRPFHVDMPADADFPAPNFLDAIFEDPAGLRYKMGGPGDYIPWGWNVYYWCRWQFDRITLASWQAAVDRRVSNLEKFRAAWQEEIEYRKRQIEPWIMRKLESVSDADWNEYLKLAWNRPPGVSLKQAKTYLDLGRSPRPERTYGRVAPA